MKKASLVLLIIIGFPVLLTIFLKLSAFQFAPGTVDSWIAFWGSYVGAIVGASVVYFVAQLQMKKQQELQIEAIKLENKHSTSREMEQFLITTKLDKYEKIIEVCERLSDITIKISNEFVSFVTYKDIINNKEDSQKENEYKEKVYEIKIKHHEYHSLLIQNTSKLGTLSNYSPDIVESCTKLTVKINNLWLEARECYLSKDGYKNYLKPNERYLLEDAEFIMDTLMYLIKDLNKKISNELIKIEKKI